MAFDDETLRAIARELVETVRSNVSIDWTLRENDRARLRDLVKRVLRKHGYPPDKQESATRTVSEQAEVFASGWAARYSDKLAAWFFRGRSGRSVTYRSRRLKLLMAIGRHRLSVHVRSISRRSCQLLGPASSISSPAGLDPCRALRLCRGVVRGPMTQAVSGAHPRRLKRLLQGPALPVVADAPVVGTTFADEFAMTLDRESHRAFVRTVGSEPLRQPRLSRGLEALF